MRGHHVLQRAHDIIFDLLRLDRYESPLFQFDSEAICQCDRVETKPIKKIHGTASPPVILAFCKIVAGEAPASVIYQDDQVMAFMTLHPTPPGEFLIIPKGHIDEKG